MKFKDITEGPNVGHSTVNVGVLFMLSENPKFPLSASFLVPQRVVPLSQVQSLVPTTGNRDSTVEEEAGTGSDTAATYIYGTVY